MISRRSVLKVALVAPLLATVGLPRTPYVVVGQSVDFIGMALHPAPTFTGSAIVREVGGWNGEHYPCQLDQCGYTLDGSFADGDLALLRVEAAEFTWRDPQTRERYPNLAAYMREKRFGENPLTYHERRYLPARPDLYRALSGRVPA